MHLLDLTAALRAERAHDDPAVGDFSYYPLGTHWTYRSGWAAAEALAAELALRHPLVQPLERGDWQRRLLDHVPQDSWANEMLCEDLVREAMWGFDPRRPGSAHPSEVDPASGPGAERAYVNDRTELPTLLMLHDSFGPFVEPALAEHASRLSTLWGHHFFKDRILAERPQIVIELYSERMLIRPPQANVPDGVRVEPAVFAGLQRARPELDDAALLAAIEPYAHTAIGLEEEGRALRITAEPQRDRVLLPEIKPPEGRSVCLALDLVAPEPTVLSFWYLTRTTSEYDDEHRVSVPLEAGPNAVCVRLPVAGLRGKILMQLGWSAGRYLLRKLDLRW